MKELGINERIELQKIDELIKYRTTVQELNQDNFAVSVPSNNGQYLLLYSGDKVFVTIFGDYERFRFTTTLVGRTKDKIPLYILNNPKNIERIQDRDFVRIKTSLDVLYQKFLPSDYENMSSIKPENKCTSIDISGGGCLLALNNELSLYDFVYLKIKIPEYTDKYNSYEEQFISVLGKVVRRVTKDINFRGGLGISFQNMSEIDREYLIKYIFYKMREQSKLKR